MDTEHSSEFWQDEFDYLDQVSDLDKSYAEYLDLRTSARKVIEALDEAYCNLYARYGLVAAPAVDKVTALNATKNNRPYPPTLWDIKQELENGNGH